MEGSDELSRRAAMGGSGVLILTVLTRLVNFNPFVLGRVGKLALESSHTSSGKLVASYPSGEGRLAEGAER